jgi:hypothetical protein
MIRFLFRFLGLWFLAGAFVALVIDGTYSIAASRLILTPVREIWDAIHPSSLDLLRSLVERNLSPWLWEKVFLTLLFTPLWLLLGVLGVVLVLLGRPRVRPIGYSSRD